MSFSDFALFKLHSIRPALSLLNVVGELGRSFIGGDLTAHEGLAQSWTRQRMDTSEILKGRRDGELVIHRLSQDERI